MPTGGAWSKEAKYSFSKESNAIMLAGGEADEQISQGGGSEAFSIKRGRLVTYFWCCPSTGKILAVLRQSITIHATLSFSSFGVHPCRTHWTVHVGVASQCHDRQNQISSVIKMTNNVPRWRSEWNYSYPGHDCLELGCKGSTEFRCTVTI